MEGIHAMSVYVVHLVIVSVSLKAVALTLAPQVWTFNILFVSCHSFPLLFVPLAIYTLGHSCPQQFVPLASVSIEGVICTFCHSFPLPFVPPAIDTSSRSCPRQFVPLASVSIEGVIWIFRHSFPLPFVLPAVLGDRFPGSVSLASVVISCHSFPLPFVLPAVLGNRFPSSVSLASVLASYSLKVPPSSKTHLYEDWTVSGKVLSFVLSAVRSPCCSFPWPFPHSAIRAPSSSCPRCRFLFPAHWRSHHPRWPSSWGLDDEWRSFHSFGPSTWPSDCPSTCPSAFSTSMSRPSTCRSACPIGVPLGVFDFFVMPLDIRYVSIDVLVGLIGSNTNTFWADSFPAHGHFYRQKRFPPFPFQKCRLHHVVRREAKEWLNLYIQS